MMRNLLYFVCRHHMHEVIIDKIFTDPFGPTLCPNIALVERFQQSWATINQENFVALDDTRLQIPVTAAQSRDSFLLAVFPVN